MNNSVDSYNNKYNFTLEVLNTILQNIQGDKHVPINDIVEFKDIERDDFISEVNIEYIKSKDFIKRCIDIYGKDDNIYHKTYAKAASVSVVKFLANCLNHSLLSKRYDKPIIANGKKARQAVILYTIVKLTN